MHSSLNFRQEARALGLTGGADLTRRARRLYIFDLNEGTIRLLEPNPERALELIKLAHRCSGYSSMGEHISLLRLIARRSELGQNHIFWLRPYHRNNSEEWVSLRDWLIEQGQSLNSIEEKSD